MEQRVTVGPIVAWAGSVTIATINQVLGAISLVLTIAYTLWRWRRDAKSKGDSQ